MTTNERFFLLLTDTHISQKQFSDNTGIPTSTISAWKKRNTDIPASYISTIADFFNVSYEYLLTGKEPMLPSQSPFTDDELEVLQNYRALDSRGQHQLHLSIYKELDRIKEEKTLEDRPIPFAASGEANITQENYENFQQKLKAFDKRARELEGR